MVQTKQVGLCIGNNNTAEQKATLGTLLLVVRQYNTQIFNVCSKNDGQLLAA